MARADHDSRNTALKATAARLRNSDSILSANEKDIAAAEMRDKGAAMIGRLTLNPIVSGHGQGLEDICTLEDPIGRELDRWQRPNGLDIARVSTPLGVLGVIYDRAPMSPLMPPVWRSSPAIRLYSVAAVIRSIPRPCWRS